MNMIHIYTHMIYMYAYICRFMCVCAYICIHMYVYIYVYMQYVENERTLELAEGRSLLSKTVQKRPGKTVKKQFLVQMPDARLHISQHVSKETHCKAKETYYTIKKRPAIRQNRPTIRQKRPNERKKRPIMRQMRPAVRQKRPRIFAIYTACVCVCCMIYVAACIRV